MKKNQLYHKLAIERCHMYVAQLCAANYIDADKQEEACGQHETTEALLKRLSRDLKVLEQVLGVQK